MELNELKKLVDTVYGIVGEQYSDDFKYVIGGCHCTPATEWLGDLYMAFKKVINDDAINDTYLKMQMIDAIKWLLK
jgi:hypothetical protein